MNTLTLTANLINIFSEEIYPASVVVENGRIKGIKTSGKEPDPSLPYVLPGLIDAHVHIESSMLVPSEFARLAVVHGTVATVSDPHEIANVLGLEGVQFMLENAKQVPFNFYFGAPSCVPATSFETSGATLGVTAVEELLHREDIFYLSEMMNFPGVLNGEDEVMKKIEAARKVNKPVDGHAPGLRGEEAKRYAEAGIKGEVVISTDHECFTREEALDKLKAGMKIIIRQGSAAKNFDALIELLKEYPDEMMFCSDDKHPDSLVQGHINRLVNRALKRGVPLFHALKAACLNPVKHYGLKTGLLREGDPADFIMISDPEEFQVVQTYIRGQKVAENGKTMIPSVKVEPVNRFNCSKKIPEDFQVTASSEKIRVIEAVDGELVTNSIEVRMQSQNGNLLPDPAQDILKIAVVNRYRNEKPAVAFIKNFGIKSGAIASSVAHDSHNIVVAGSSNEMISKAVNLVIAHKGGICAVTPSDEKILPLPVAGLMSMEDGYEVAKEYAALDQMAKEMGSRLGAPFMTLSFMALLVIPHLKLSDKGLFDGDRFTFTPLEIP